MGLGDNVEQHLENILQSAITDLRNAGCDIINNLTKIADDRLPIVNNELRSLQLWAADERKAWVTDLHGVLDRLEGMKATVNSTINVELHIPPKKQTE